MSWKTFAQEKGKEDAKAIRDELRELVEFYKGECQKVNDRLDICLAIEEQSKKSIPTIKAERGKASESVALMIASDWHSEETVDPKTINGLNRFNRRIANERIDNFFTNGLRLVEIQRNGTDIDTLVLGLLGDFMSGYIHEELVEGNSLSPTETTLWIHEKICAGIKYLLDNGNFKKVVVPCCVGNHGRTTQKKRVSTAYKNSYEWLMYHFISRTISDPRLEFAIPQSYHNYVQIYDKTVRFHHGDSIRYQGGVGGITIPVNKAIGQWDKGKRANYDVFGHYHQFKKDSKWICNGSLIGFNAYAVEIKAEFEAPQQAFFLIEKNHGKTIEAPIFL